MEVRMNIYTVFIHKDYQALQQDLKTCRKFATWHFEKEALKVASSSAMTELIFGG